MMTKSARRRRIVMPLLVATLVGIVVVLLLGAGQQSKVIGAGSTLAQPLVEGAAVAYRDSLNADNPTRPQQTGNDWVLDGSGVEYEPVGSLGGVMRLADPEIDFAVSDYPLSAESLTERNLGQFPIAVGSIAVVHNLSLPEGQKLRLDAPTLAKINLGSISRWNDPALVTLNPDLDLSDVAINSVHRTDGSGSTVGFTKYLADGSSEWADGPGTSPLIDWPTGTGSERSSGLIAAVQQTEGSIGYVEPGQAERAGLQLAELENRAGRFVLPDEATIRAAIADVNWSGENDYADPVPQSGATDAYPITVPIYAVVERAPEYERDTRRTLGYLRFLIEEYDGAVSELGYLPLPEPAAEAVRTYWIDTFGLNR